MPVLLLAALLSIASVARAADCPADAFALWSAGILRGANVFQGRNPGGASSGFGDGDFTQADFDDLAAAGANYVQLSHAGLFAQTPPYALDGAAEANLDQMIAMAGAANLYAVIAFRSGPGRNENAVSNRDGNVLETIWTDAAARTAWVDMLRHTAARHGGNPTVIGYSIMVEPNAYARRGFVDPPDFYAQFGGTLEDVNGLYALAVAAIREVDPETPVLLEPEGFGNVTWLPFLTPIADAHVVYTAHDYTPFDYTHQQVANASYPGEYDVDGTLRNVDAAFLASYLQPLQAYVDAHGVPVALTEFGVHAIAPNAATYLTDRIAVQDQLGSWAVWVWQPAGFVDPFNVHDPSPALDVLKAAWSANCRRPGTGGGAGTAVVTGRARKLTRGGKAGKAGKALPKVLVTIGSSTQLTPRRPRRGSYELEVPSGTQHVTAAGPGRTCVIGTADGPEALDVVLAAGERRTVDVFCRKISR